MSDEQDKLKLSLEPPKLFGRKKKSDATGTSKSASPASGPPAPADSEPEAPPAEEPVEEPTVEVVEEPAAEAAPAPVKKTAPAKKTAPVKKAAPAETTVPAKKAVAAKTSVAPAAPTKPARPRAKLAPEIEPEPITAIHHEDDIVPSDADEPPLLPFYPAAAVTGVLVGATMIVLTWLSLRGCETVRGTSSCGGGPGLLLLIGTFVVCILLGGALLKVFQIPDPGSSSFLGVGLVAVISLLFLIDVLDHWSMLIVIPVISIGGFLASVWVTKTFVEPGTE